MYGPVLLLIGGVVTVIELIAKKKKAAKVVPSPTPAPAVESKPSETPAAE